MASLVYSYKPATALADEGTTALADSRTGIQEPLQGGVEVSCVDVMVIGGGNSARPSRAYVHVCHVFV